MNINECLDAMKKLDGLYNVLSPEEYSELRSDILKQYRESRDGPKFTLTGTATPSSWTYTNSTGTL